MALQFTLGNTIPLTYRKDLEELLHKYLGTLDRLGYEITIARYKGKEYVELYLYGPWMDSMEDHEVVEILISRLDEMPDEILREVITGIWKLTDFYRSRKLRTLI